MSITARFPAAVDTIVAGGGTAGAAVAGRLAEGSAEHTLLLEAGPDYGQPAAAGGRVTCSTRHPSRRPTTGATRASSLARSSGSAARA
jgi:choline dehydrogenase-like flavoprotein